TTYDVNEHAEGNSRETPYCFGVNIFRGNGLLTPEEMDLIATRKVGQVVRTRRYLRRKMNDPKRYSGGSKKPKRKMLPNEGKM
ncbi:hypothetical protein KDA14_03075, partial [Candidatus Saccharibacteria bacterium]|nr:hypothetical protein [Candidatus Saccharibacteria bacterium]